MIYLINGVLKYNAYDGTLYLIDGGIDMLTLGRVANELLFLMVENNDVPLSREDILNELWSKKGLTPSSNNLNNYISILRKALSSCGFPELIVTIPRHGFMFSAEIDEMPDSIRDGGRLQGIGETYGGLGEYTGIFSRRVQSKLLFFMRRKVSLLTILLLAFLIFSSYYIVAWRNTIGGKYENFVVDKCSIYFLDELNGENGSHGDLLSIKRYLFKYKINCGRKSDVFYWPGKNSLIAYCAHNKWVPCVNYGLLDREK